VVKLQIDPNVEKLKLVNSLTKKKNPEHRSDQVLTLYGKWNSEASEN
jgi:hypothetical protein